MRSQKKSIGSSFASSSRTQDARFASFQTDPRFRLPSKKHTKTKLDKRFAGMLDDEDFTAVAKVDRYGRKIKSDSKKKALQRLYEPEDENEGEEKDTESQDDDEEGEVEVDDDEIVQRELRAAHEKDKPKNYDPARHGGFSSSESESDSDEDSDDDENEDGGVDLDTEGDLQRLQDEQADVATGEVTNRIAIVNLDWDHVRSTDLMALFSSFLPESSSGRIVKISVYPSEFGKERMQQEEIEGPPKALFKNDKDSDDDSEDDSEDEDEKIKKELIQQGDDQDFDSNALRAYQLDRLRYYYAVMVCSSPETAHKIYEATDGTEYQSSSNVIDLRFVPDDVTFDDEPRDECDKIPDTYKPVDFVTNALQSSKVKLTWDMHPEEVTRKASINRAFTGSRADVEENDLRAYLASDSEDDDEDEDEEINGGDAEAGEPKLSKKELARKKMREALGLSSESAPKKSKNDPVGDMEITFAPALAESKSKDADKEETTIEKYKRKEKERKERKRQAAKSKRGGAEGSDDDEVQGAAGATDGEDLGFNDPFFTTEDPDAPTSKASIRKQERLKKRQIREAAEAESATQKAQLKKVLSESANDKQVDHLDHFDMNEIMRAEKKKNKKGKKGKNKGKDQDDGKIVGLQEDFVMDLGDDRFKAVFDSHEFAIDPSNPNFKSTGAMKQLLEEGRKKRRAVNAEEEPSSKKVKKGRR
ncbi:pre-rRNA-processing protein esf1 [Conoideocrella luteorostrata]|uniref:Pre-rRNA-processing protein esf1 n=1 Tax=Conoideocrella luteorostrata TaxID=1105319 RepID=A0AAJ0FNW5_9HYPO|nr:pre-rRNA-processing protein esf1 [Conoideocrella luteorostrata]